MLSKLSIHNTNSAEKAKKKKVNWTRILALVLAFIMFASMGTLAVSILLGDASAEDYSFSETDYTFSAKTDGNTYIAVGLMYGSGVTVSFEVKAPYGFVIGDTTIGQNDRGFNSFYHLKSDIAAVTVDKGLYKKSMAYYMTDDPNQTLVGGYHVELKNNISDSIPLDMMISDVKSMLTDKSMYAFPARIDGANRVRVGQFATSDQAAEALNKIGGQFIGYTASVVGPSKTCSTVLNPNTDEILFEFDAGSNADSYIGLAAFQGDEYEAYVQTPANNLYAGVMAFRPYYSDAATGIALTNMLELESYVEGVLPYEISNTWSREVLRTFAITIRSYALANYCKWYKTYGFDLTCTTSDQVYRGRNRVNDAIIEAVESTKGLVTSHNGKISSAYYSSSVGGSTISCEYTWGSERGYLKHIDTPWERYSEYNKGTWYSEVSPEELCQKLRSRGYTELKGAIASISYETAPDDSGYMYQMTFTDTSGNSITIKRSDNVRTALSGYLNSANFIVAKNSLDFTYDEVLDIEVIGGIGTNDPSGDIGNILLDGFMTESSKLVISSDIISENGDIQPCNEAIAYVLTSTGRKVIMSSRVALGEPADNTVPFTYDNVNVMFEGEDSSDELPDGEATDTNNDTTDTSSENETESTSPETDLDTSADTTITDDTIVSYGEGLEVLTAPEYLSEISAQATDNVEDASSHVKTTTVNLGNDIYKITSEFGNITIVTTVRRVTETIKAEKSGNFIFAGKGWGHGVGISQYGAKDLSDAGVAAEDILKIYFTDIKIVHMDEVVR